MQNPIKKYKGKNNKEYKYYSADFSSIRFRQFQLIYYQARGIVRNNNIHTVLEFRGGRNTTCALSHNMGIEYIDVSLSENMFPDIYSSITDYEYVGKQYDMVCSFQCLEHNPFVDLDTLVSHMLKFSKKYFIEVITFHLVLY